MSGTGGSKERPPCLLEQTENCIIYDTPLRWWYGAHHTYGIGTGFFKGAPSLVWWDSTHGESIVGYNCNHHVIQGGPYGGASWKNSIYVRSCVYDDHITIWCDFAFVQGNNTLKSESLFSLQWISRHHHRHIFLSLCCSTPPHTQSRINKWIITVLFFPSVVPSCD